MFSVVSRLVLTALSAAMAFGGATTATADVRGPDVSGHQHPSGYSISWSSTSANGSEFAFVKATEGLGYTNPYFAGDFAALGSADMVRGAYHFARPRAGSADAVALYRGDFLDGFFLSHAAQAFEHWVDEQRARLRGMAARAVWAVAATRRAAGDVSGAVDMARRAASFSPDSEPEVARVIAFLDAAGDRGGALAAYDDLVRRLATEFEAEPAPETRALVREIRSRSQAAGRSSRALLLVATGGVLTVGAFVTTLSGHHVVATSRVRPDSTVFTPSDTTLVERTGHRLALGAGRRPHGVAPRLAFEHRLTRLAGHEDLELRHRLRRVHAHHLGLCRDRVTDVDRCRELPGLAEEHGPGAGKVHGDKGVQEARGESALHDEAAEACPFGERLIEVQRVVVASEPGERLDVLAGERQRTPGGLANLQSHDVLSSFTASFTKLGCTACVSRALRTLLAAERRSMTIVVSLEYSRRLNATVMPNVSRPGMQSERAVARPTRCGRT